MKSKGYSKPPPSYDVWTYSYTETTTTEKVGPLLTTSWDQNPPYNNDVPNKYPAGCVAIALGQIANYHEKAKKSYDWSLLDHSEGYTKGDKEKAKFIYDIGKAVKMKYAQSGSGAQRSDAAQYLSSSGYKNVNLRLDGFTWSVYKDRLDTKNSQGRRMIVYLAGCAQEAVVKKSGCLAWLLPFWWCHYIEYSQCHAWVGDGYKVVRKRDIYKSGSSSRHQNTRYTKYLHMNWGWDTGNGWTTYTYWKSPLGNYKYKKAMITYSVD